MAIVSRLARIGDRAAFHTLVLRADELPLVLVEPEMPVTNPRWEFRTSGLWVEAVCEQAGVHWSYGLEAFAVAIDEPEELLGRGYGHRTALGWELDFVVDVDHRTDDDRTGDDECGERGDEEGDDAGLDEATTVEVGRVEGLLLTGPGDETPVAGDGWRLAWDEIDLGHWPAGPPAVVGEPVEVALPLAGPGGTGPVWWVGHDGHDLTARWSADTGHR
ncbi:MAG: hypothetical protein AAGA93_22175 [Actinomycetota bacterium]